MYRSQRGNSAKQLLGLDINKNYSRDEITQAFRIKVSELSQQQLSSEDYRHKLNQLYAAHEYLQNRPRGVQYQQQQQSMFPSFGYPFNSLFKHIEDAMDGNGYANSNRYYKSFSKFVTVDKDGKVIGNSQKVIQDNDKTFKEEKHFNSAENKVHIKRIDTDGSVKEYDKPYTSSRYQFSTKQISG